MQSDRFVSSRPEIGSGISGNFLSPPWHEVLKPEEVIDCIRELHDRDDQEVCNDIVDQILGLQREDIEKNLQNLRGLTWRNTRYPQEQIWIGGSEVIWTPYQQIRNMVKRLALVPEDVFYDLGSGYGRVALYTAITSPARVKGVELVQERAEKAIAASQRLDLSAEFIVGNVLDQDYSDATVFYTYHPFSPETFKKVVEILRDVAYRRQITIAAKLDQYFMHQQDWLTPINYDENEPITIFKSK